MPTVDEGKKAKKVSDTQFLQKDKVRKQLNDEIEKKRKECEEKLKEFHSKIDSRIFKRKQEEENESQEKRVS